MALNAREVLQLIITGDGRGAIAEMERVSDASKRTLGETEKTLSQIGSRVTGIGLGASAGGLLAGAGLYRFADAAGDLSEAISAANVVMGEEGAAAMEAYAEQADKTAGISKRAALEAGALFGLFVKKAGYDGSEIGEISADLVQLAGDIASLRNIPTDTALDSISSALAGEAESIRRYGIDVSDAALRQAIFDRTGQKVTGTLTQQQKLLETLNQLFEQGAVFQGDFVNTADELANRQKQVNAEWENTRAQLGEALLPAFESLVGVVQGALGGFNELDDGTQRLVATTLGVGTAATIAGGGLAIIVGQGMRAVDAFRSLDTRLRDADGNLTRLGRTARGMGAAVGAAGAAFAVYELVDALNTASRDSVGFETALNRIKELAPGPGELVDPSNAAQVAELDKQIAEAARSMEGWGDRIWDFFRAGRGEPPPRVRFGDQVEQIDNLSRALKELQETGQDDLLRNMVVRLRDALELIDDPGMADNEAFAALQADLAGYEAYLDSAAAAAKASERANRDHAASGREVGTSAADAAWTLDKLAYSFGRADVAADDAAAGAREYADALKAGFDPILGLADANLRLAEAEDRLAEVASMNSRDIIDAHRGLEDARRRVDDATRNLADAQERLNEALSDDPLFGLRSMSPEQELADARNRLAEANRRLAANPDDALALTMRDVAISDMEDANRRVQQAKRDAEHRADQIKHAQRAVDDARRGLDDAHRGVADAEARLAEVYSQHGPESDAYRKAAHDVIRANLDVQTSVANLAVFIEEHGIEAIGEINEELDRWIAKGGPLADAARDLKAQMQPLLEQTLLWAAGLRGVRDEINELNRLAREGFTVGMLGAAGPSGTGYSAAPPSGRSSRSYYSPRNQPGSGGGSGGGGGGGGSWGRQLGGPVDPGKPYKVAELEPEAVIFSRPGQVIPNLRQFAEMAAAAGGSSGPTLVLDGVNITLHARDDQVAGAAVVHALRTIARRSGRGLRVADMDKALR